MESTQISLFMYLYGVGRPLAITILDTLGIEKTTKIDLLPEADLIESVMNSKNIIEGDLRREVSTNIKRFQEINCYRGQRPQETTSSSWSEN